MAPRTWKLILAVSLALNLFLAGAGLGALLVGGRFIAERAGTPRRGGPGLWAALQALPPERRSVLRDLLREEAANAAPDLREAREARRKAVRLITAPTYDPAAVSAALQEARSAQARAGARVDAAIAARLGDLTPGERAAFARFILRAPAGRRGPPPPPGPPPPESGAGPSPPEPAG